MKATLASINVSQGGVPKLPLESDEAEVRELGIVGDAVRNTKLHGGPDKALCLWSSEVLAELRGEGHPIEAGSAGENLTLSGLDWGQLVPGTRVRIGELELEISDYTTPCRHNAQWFKDGDFMRMSQKRYPGSSRLYARVRSAGRIRVGDAVSLQP